jgi:N6-adenosine-specific RNA methylase IME4
MAETLDSSRPCNEAYGRLKEGVHIAGYTFERACHELEWLIADDYRWKVCSNKGFTNINDFIRSIQLDDLRPVAEARKRIAKRIKELQPQVSNRAIAGALGVDEGTIRGDIAENSAPGEKKANKNKGENEATAENSAPAPVGELSGERAARVVMQREAAGMNRLEVIRQGAAIRAEPPPYPGHGPYRVIVVDPPWPYEIRAEDVSHRAAHDYPTMTLEQIRAESPKVDAIAHQDCILWLWVTNHHMREAFTVLDAWGFEQKTMLTWAKDRMGTGDWLRGQTEHCLMAVRGKPIVTLTNQTTLLHGPLREASRKPDQFFAFVESLCPAPRYAYLFARTTRHGWDCHGDEVGLFAAE